MKKLLLLNLLILLISPSLAMSADYYYCDCQAGADSSCVAGDDARNGTDLNQPRRSFSHAQSIFASLDAGDTIHFCRGGSFTSGSGSRWVNTNCTGSNRCSVTDYEPAWQTSQLPRPIITKTTDGTLFGLDDSGNADHEEGYNFSNLDLRCTACSHDGTGWAFFLYNDVDDVTIDNLHIEGFKMGVFLGGHNPLNAGSDGTLDRIILRNLNIVNNKTQGVMGGANDLILEDSYFENNGGGTFFDHNIYLSKGRNIIVRRNELYRATIDANGACHGPSFVAHGVIDTMLIENNLIREDVGLATSFCWGIAVDPGYPSAESFTNITIRDNTIVNVGNAGIDLASCINCVVENNIVVHQQPHGITAIRAAMENKGDGDATQTAVTIRNNSIYITASPSGGIAGTGVQLGTEGSQHILVNNAIYYTGTARFRCLHTNLAADAYTAIDNNVCYFPNASPDSEWELGSGTTPDPLSAWQISSGMGGSSQYANPGFSQPEVPYLNFTPNSATANVVGKGHPTLSAILDFRGKNRDAQPDAGAIEFGTFNPPVPPSLYIN